MKRLTINDIAKASLRTGKRAYLSLAIGIFLSIFLVTTMFVCAWSIRLDMKEDDARIWGRQDFLLLDSDVSDERLMSEGHFERLGHVYVSALIGNTGRTIGWYDEEADEIIFRQLVSGRMPERAGEIALEQSVLEQLRLSESVGDTIELSLLPIDGAEETRSFTIVGILDERTTQWDLSASVIYFPSALIAPEEAAFATGRTVLHRVMTLSDVSAKEALSYWTTTGNLQYSMLASDRGIFTAFYEDIDALDLFAEWYSLTTVTIVFIGLSLLIACGVGISQAMESRLSQRTEQIGMLRAVGATRRQIRRIFGRETWLLMLILTPASVAAGCGFAYFLAAFFPEQMIFGADWRLLLPVVLVSALTILLSARIPLRRASFIAPMGVIRDVGLLRRAKSIKVKKNFRPERLIPLRLIRLYPSRHIGSAVLIALMMFCVMMAATLGSVEAGLTWKEKAEFRLYSVEAPGAYNDWNYGMSDSDIAQMNALPMVEHLALTRDYEDSTYLLVDQPADYFKPVMMSSNLHLYEGEEIPQNLMDFIQKWWEAEDLTSSIQNAAEKHREAQQALGLDQTMVRFRVEGVNLTQQQAEALAPYVVEGDIDIEALNAGREVLVFAPTEYDYINWESQSWRTDYSPREEERYELISVRENDAFYAGQQLQMLQFDRATVTDYGRLGAHMAEAEYQNLSFTIGAVLSCPNYEVYDVLDAAMSPAIITTEQGAKAMGLYRGWLQDIGVHLTGEIDSATEEYLVKRISAIGMRSGSYTLDNHLELVRTEEEAQRQMITAFVSMGIVFLAVAVSLIAGNMRRRLRADHRMIGTLRAVGADRRTLMRCYSGQMGFAMVVGMLIGFAVMSVAVPALGSMMYGYTSAIVKAACMMMLFVLVCWLACVISLRMTLKDVMDRTVVENIREL